MTKKQFNIRETTKLTELSASVLRIWELRYGWPKPARKANGYRTYNESLIQDLLWVKSQVVAGKSLRELVDDDGNLICNKKQTKKALPTGLRLDFTSFPLPLTVDGLQLREEVEQAIRTGNEGQLTRLQSMALRLRPSERELAITAIMRAVTTPQI